MSELDCGDNSCLFATRKDGMRTNGGCRCIPPGHARLSIKIQEILNERRRQDATIDALREEVERLKAVVENGCVQADGDGIYDMCPFRSRLAVAEGNVEMLINFIPEGFPMPLGWTQLVKQVRGEP